MSFDAVVVGAGPAGSTAAWKLARAGVWVLLIDGSEFGRSKPCGEAFSPGGDASARRDGVLDELRDAGAATLRGFPLRTPEGRFVSAGFGPVCDGIPSEALALSRRRFDAVLLDAAIAAGAEFRAPLRVFDVAAPGVDDTGVGGSRSPVRLRARSRSGGEVTLGARWVIGADGRAAESRARVWRRVAPLYHHFRQKCQKAETSRRVSNDRALVSGRLNAVPSTSG